MLHITTPTANNLSRYKCVGYGRCYYHAEFTLFVFFVLTLNDCEQTFKSRKLSEFLLVHLSTRLQNVINCSHAMPLIRC